MNCFHNQRYFHYNNYKIASKLYDTNNINEEYRNIVARFLSQLLPNNNNSNNNSNNNNVLDKIEWTKPKRRKTSLSILCKDLKSSIQDREWFVTGNVEPKFFDDNFAFQVYYINIVILIILLASNCNYYKDPDVKLKGIENYAIGVNKLFTQG